MNSKQRQDLEQIVHRSLYQNITPNLTILLVDSNHERPRMASLLRKELEFANDFMHLSEI